MKCKLLLPFLMPIFLLNLGGCTDSKKITALGEEILQYVNMDVSYRIEENRAITSLYVSVQANPKPGYSIEKITCYVQCGISFSATKFDGTDLSDFKSIEIYVYAGGQKFEEYVEGAETISNVTAYFEKFVYRVSGCQCDLIKV